MIPGKLLNSLENFRQDRDDILLSRKSEIYSEAINESVKAAIAYPTTFCGTTPSDASTVWGKGQMADRDIATTSIALAFAELTEQERELLASIRELFRSGKDTRGAGDLNKLLPRGGFVSIADDLLPRYVRKRELRDSEPIGRLRGYWRDEEKSKLIGLAQILPLAQFLKLNGEEDTSRMLEALWRTVRMDFESFDTRILERRFDSEIRVCLEDCWSLEEALKRVGATGIDYAALETLVKSKQGIIVLLSALRQSIADTGSAAPLVRQIVSIFSNALLDEVESNIRSLASVSGGTKRALEELTKTAANLKRNLFEHSKAAKFAGVTQEHLDRIIKDQMTIGGNPQWTTLESEIRNRREYLASISSSLGKLQTKLDDLEGLFSQVKR
jgi:hypothetical protein